MTKAREENLAKLVTLVSYGALRLQAIARSVHRLDEAYCNGNLSNTQQARLAKLLNEARIITRNKHLTVYHQSDPRGWPLYVFCPSDLKGTSICVVYRTIGIGVSPF